MSTERSLVSLASIDKRALVAEVLERLGATMAQMAESARSAAEAATHPEARPEDPKDMRSTETSYLARGQAMRVEELAEQIQRLRFFEPGRYGDADPIGVGALVAVDDEEDERRVFFLLPHGGGIELVRGGASILVITGTSPMGKAMLGRTAGDDLELIVQGRKREYVVAEVA